MEQIIYMKVSGTFSNFVCDVDLDLKSLQFTDSESNWIIPEFVRPIHYSIFEDE